ncbi:MAG TPA: adenosylcobalamin-dependent ribonucleoside-diphosphate reductase [Methanomassiliicoccales archaeon]|jgi:ribonucleoside-diphosphate reductase alpha chain
MSDKFPKLSENALTVLRKRYLLKGRSGEVIETPEDMFRRIARNLASVDYFYHDRDAEKEEVEFHRMMRSLEFLPNSPTIMNAGTHMQQLAACFVIPVGDSIEQIFDAVKFAAIIHQTGGGTGFSFSRLRPSGDLVASTGGTASGPISFMKVFDVATDAVKQGGRRRGANMGILRVDHPDIREFIRLKADLKTLSNFNISVGVTDEFMHRASEGRQLELINPRNSNVTGSVHAGSLLDEICSRAWGSGDPGMIFLDEINRRNPTPGLGDIEATNPCGEVPLLSFEACNLGSINLDRMLVERKGDHELDYDKLKDTVDAGIRFLDNVIDASRYPLRQIDLVVKGNRKVGLGVMGFADILVKLGHRYGSKASEVLAEEVIRTIRDQAERTTRRIGEERGDFPNIEASEFDSPRRNATVLSIAPTGTISMIANCSSGIEPFFALYYDKHVLDGETLHEMNQFFLDTAGRKGLERDRILGLLSNQDSIQNIESIPEEMRNIFVTAHDIEPEKQVRMQSIFQRYVDNAVSKTINLPESSTVEDIRKIYHLAHELHCKGITVYREGTKPGQVYTAGGRGVECATCGQLV